MAIVEIAQEGAKKIIGSTPKETSWVGDVINILKEVNQFTNSPIVKIVAQRMGYQEESGSTLGSGNTGKTIKSDRKAPAPAVAPQDPKAGGFSNEDMTKFFSTPEGLNKITDAIDQLQPIIGDAKLSEVKELIKMVGGKKENEINKTGNNEKAGAGSKKPKSRKTTKSKKLN